MKKTVKMIIAAILLAIILILSVFLKNHTIFTGFSLLFSITALFVGVVIFLENRHPSSTLAWLIVLALFPLLGFIVYLFVGQSYRKQKMFYRKSLEDEDFYLQIETRLSKESSLNWMDAHQKQFLKLASKLGKTPVSFASETTVLADGEEKFAALFEMIDKAKRHIHLEYYILRSDKTGNKLKEKLIAKAREGVEVRLLYDAVGCLALQESYIYELRNEGIKAEPFFPVKLPYFNQKINFRNHRKIVVVDGQTGLVGGLNIGDEYMGLHPYYGHWRDTHLKVTGEAVNSLQLIFLQDWRHATGEKLVPDFFIHPSPSEAQRNQGGVQLIAGGPDNEWEVMKNLYFSMIVSARKSVWIASPYFVPDEEVYMALKVAALSGIDVKILVPNKPDKRTVFYASRSYFSELLKAGAEIYEYENGFMHSKFVIVDGEMASVGTCNMDMRSFHLNFEVNAFLYKTESIQSLQYHYENDLTFSKKMDLGDFSSRKFRYRVFESLARLLSPLL
ncbi:cardiolipin synthase [Fictibacillus iocasae]|uniref:Cardiolipin synthase n=1 Tax=Fictibacillus iocasae TaxID=2715437 RepID=A0ABW2NMF7_9BACL